MRILIRVLRGLQSWQLSRSLRTMKPRILCLLLAGLPFGAGLAAVNDSSEPRADAPARNWTAAARDAAAEELVPAKPQITESTLGVGGFRALYQPTVGEDLPKLVVFDANGHCAGFADADASGKLPTVIEGLLKKPAKNCSLFLSTEFGATSPNEAKGPGQATVMLLGFNIEFCTACLAMADEIRTLAKSGRYPYLWQLTWVSLDAAHNPKN
ncbi:MAG: hypothetical protein AB7V26_01835 [Lysobacterales bacterium]